MARSSPSLNLTSLGTPFLASLILRIARTPLPAAAVVTHLPERRFPQASEIVMAKHRRLNLRDRVLNSAATPGAAGSCNGGVRRYQFGSSRPRFSMALTTAVPETNASPGRSDRLGLDPFSA